MRPIPHTTRGTTLIEAIIALTVLLIGMTGFATLLPVISRANQFSRRVTVATTIATDLEENVHRWAYTDGRLGPSMTLTGCDTATMAACFADAVNVIPKWDMGKTTAGAYVPNFSDANLGPTWQGLSADADRDGTAEFFRFWNVFAVDPAGTGIANGKLVQIIVRWKEPGYGFRQIATSTFKPNPAAALQP